MTPQDYDDKSAQVITLLCFLAGCALCALRFGLVVGWIVFLIGSAVVGEMQRLANKYGAPPSDRQER